MISKYLLSNRRSDRRLWPLFPSIHISFYYFKQNFLSKFKPKMKILFNDTIEKKNGKLFLHTFQNIAHLLGSKIEFGHL